MKVAIVSAAYGPGHEPPPLSVVDPSIDAVLVTDRPMRVAGWRTVVDPRAQLTRRMAAKVPKARPDLYTDADVMIWVDAQFAIVSLGGFVTWCLDWLNSGCIAMMRHPYRSSLHAEAVAGQGRQGRGRFDGQDSVGQARHYLASGHPDGWGVWATGIIARSACPETAAFGDRWLLEQTLWSSHDQVSAPYALRETVGLPNDLPFLGWQNHMFHLGERSAA